MKANIICGWYLGWGVDLDFGYKINQFKEEAIAMCHAPTQFKSFRFALRVKSKTKKSYLMIYLVYT
jgi:hypothetical protein